MEQEAHNAVSRFVVALMPSATHAEQEEAQANVDRFLDAIDRIYARRANGRVGTSGRDKPAPDDTVYTASSERI